MQREENPVLTVTNINRTDKSDAEPGNGEQCLVIHPYIKSGARGARAPEARLEEILGLAQAIGLEVVHAEITSITKIKPATLFGKGVLEDIGEIISGDRPSNLDQEFHRIDIAVIDATLTPIQQRNLEREWGCKVIDRTGLILEIFGERARTREGRLQVDLAALSYQRSRLVRSWTHLERQRGGAGFMGGPGETQIETDRRQIDQRITKLRRELKDVKRTRDLHRKSRRKVPYPIVALVGYTNAGKSTLFNQLTDSHVMAEDQLFATLDPTMRALDLPSGRQIIMSDTVGFISNLPHELITAFRATLEEVTEANLIIHVRDAAHPDSAAQKMDVIAVLSELGLDERSNDNRLEVLNKIDVLTPEDRKILINQAERMGTTVIALSALTGEGCPSLLETIDQQLSEGFVTHDIILKPADGASLAWLYDHGEVIDRRDDEFGVHLKVRMDPVNAARFERRT